MPRVSKIKEDARDLDALLYGKQSPEQITNNNIPQPKESDVIDEVGEIQPVFEFDYTSEKADLRKQAKKTIYAMANHILTSDVMDDDYIKDKIEQDINGLTELMWQRRANELIQIALMNIISKGNTTPRLFDNYSSISDKIHENNKQILATEDNLRKTYLDLKYEVQRKREEESNIPLQGEQKKVLSEPTVVQHLPEESFVTIGTKGMINNMRNLQKQAYANAEIVN